MLDWMDESNMNSLKVTEFRIQSFKNTEHINEFLNHWNTKEHESTRNKH